MFKMLYIDDFVLLFLQMLFSLSDHQFSIVLWIFFAAFTFHFPFVPSSKFTLCFSFLTVTGTAVWMCL